LLSVKGGSYISIQGDAYNQGNGVYDNSDSIFVSGNWTHNANNRCFDSIGAGWVYLNGNNQHIGGNYITHFFNLILQNTGVKLGDTDVIVDGQLNLNDRELRMNTHTAWMLNADTGSVQRTSGYVSSWQDGGLLRETNTAAPYLFPVGSDSGSFRYRPVLFTPLNANINAYKVRFCNVDPGMEGFNPDTKASFICQVNPNWYHRFYHISGSDSASITIMYDTISDGLWNNIAHWQNVPQWQSIQADAIVSGTPFNEISKFVWNNYVSPAFALAITTDSFAVAQNTGPYCILGDSVHLLSMPDSAVSYQWSGPNSFTSNVQNPTGLPASVGGIYTVTITNALGCSQTASTTVTIVAPGSGVASNSGPYCSATDTIHLFSLPDGDSLYSWTGPNSFTSNAQNPAGALAGSGGTYTVTMTSAAGCTETASTTVIVFAPGTVTASNTGPYCSNDSIQLTSLPSGDSLYAWSGPNSFTSDLENPGFAATGIGGTYTVTVTSATGCTQTASTTIQILSAPQVTAANTGPYCSVATINLLAEPAGQQTYSWAGPNSFGSSAQNPSLPALNDSGTYTVTVTDTNGCSASASTEVLVNIISGGAAVAGTDTILWKGDTIQLNAFGGVNYNWTPATSISCTTCSNPFVWPNTDITYYVSVGNNAGCSSDDSVRIMVRIRPPALLFIPNAITPNGDGYNDTWFIKDLDLYPQNDVRIVNRWGDEVFAQSPYQNQWAGTWKGENLPGGTYYYILRVLYNGEYVKFDGPITIIR
jgi:gliding motility-associated-like protein